MRKEAWIFLLFTAVFVYLLFRALYVPLVHDEIATFFRYVQVGRFIPYHCEWSTNNHILNSFLTWISYSLLGSSPIAQRLPNLLFIPVYFWFLYKISQEIKSPLLQMVFLISLVSIHHYIDFFTFSRGYGMGLAVLTGSIRYTQRYLRNGSTASMAVALLLMLFSTSSILIYVNSYILIVGIIFLKTILKTRNVRSGILSLSMIFLLGVVPILATVYYLLDIQEVGRLDYGGNDGFWEDSVRSLSNMLAGPQAPFLNAYIAIVFVGMLLFFGFLLWKKKIRSFPDPKDLFFYLLIGNVLGFILEHLLFGVLYPAERTSLQFVLFFTGSLVFILDRLPAGFRIVRTLLILPLAWFPIHFVATMNLQKAEFETFNHNIPDRYFERVRENQRAGEYPPSVQGYQLRVMRWNWLNYTRDGELCPIQFMNYPSFTADFQIADTIDYPDWQEFYSVVEVTIESPLALLERKQKFSRIPVYEGTPKQLKESDGTYLILDTLNVTPLAGKPVFVGFRLSVTSGAVPLHAWISAEVRNRDDKNVAYEYLQLDWYRPSWKTGDPEFENGLLFERFPPDAERLIIYIWNVYNVSIRVEQSKVDVFVLKSPEIINPRERY